MEREGEGHVVGVVGRDGFRLDVGDRGSSAEAPPRVDERRRDRPLDVGVRGVESAVAAPLLEGADEGVLDEVFRAILVARQHVRVPEEGCAAFGHELLQQPGPGLGRGAHHLILVVTPVNTQGSGAGLGMCCTGTPDVRYPHHV